MLVDLHVKWLLKLSTLNENLKGLTVLHKILKYQSYLCVRACVRADGRNE
jgi:hypothetical protein